MSVLKCFLPVVVMMTKFYPIVVFKTNWYLEYLSLHRYFVYDHFIKNKKILAQFSASHVPCLPNK